MLSKSLQYTYILKITVYILKKFAFGAPFFSACL